VNGCGGGVYNYQATTPALTNCIVAKNMPNEVDGVPISITSSCVLGGYSGIDGNVGIIPLDPRFNRLPAQGIDGRWANADAEVGHLRMASDSPCIDAAD